MAGFSDYLEGEVLDHVFGLDAGYAQPGIYVALWKTADITDAGSGGAEIQVPGSNGYNRSANLAGTSNWTRAANVVDNDNNIDFGPATANWGDCIQANIFDASTAGNLLILSGTITAVTINNGDTARIAAGDFDIDLD